MNFTRLIAAALRPVRFLIIAFVCTLLVFSNALPAVAGTNIGTNTRSNPGEGETRLNEILEKSQDAIRPENALSGEKMQSEANKGLNEVQGDADFQQMNRPSNSQKATSAAEQVERALEKAKDKVTGKD
jgi:DNA polymerase II large subunit